MADNTPNENGLIPTHQIWADTYLSNGMNATVAYLHIHPNVSRQTAGVEGHKIKNKPNVKSYLAKFHAEVKSKYGIDRDYVTKELLELIKSCKAQLAKSAETGRGLDSASMMGLTKALKQISELAGLHVQRLEVKSSQAVIINVVGSQELDFTSTSQLLDTKPTMILPASMSSSNPALTQGTQQADTEEVKET